MKKEVTGTKICKHCKSEIPAGAKICPNCRKKQSGKLKWIILGVVAVCIIGSFMGGGDDTDSTSSSGGSGKQTEEKITYTDVSANTLIKAMKDNSAKASKTYKGKYLRIKGKVGNIDSDAAYIDVEGDDEFDFTSIQCYTQNENQENQVVELSSGSEVTIEGKCTDVGEIMGYEVEISNIK